MKLVSVNVSRPVDVRDRKDLVRTAIFKKPVTGPVAVGKYNLDGDNVEVVQRGHGEVRIDALYEALIRPKGKDVTAVLARALEVAELAPEWRVAIQERLGSGRPAEARP